MHQVDCYNSEIQGEIMKLKYKKIIILTTMSTMGIGLLTLSISHDNTKAKETGSSQTVVEAASDENTAVEEINGIDFAAPLSAELTIAPTPTPAASPTPAPLPVFNIEQEGTYPEIDKLIDEYYTAKNNRDVDTLKSISSDPSSVDSQEDLQKKTEYIDEYRNVKTYTKKGFKEGTYIVYAYHEIKFTGIKTPAPGLAKFYIITGTDNKLKIFTGTMDADTQAYYEERNSDEDVIALIEMTDKKSDDAKNSDEDLQSFWKSMDEKVNGKK
jgi:hypothetical protein